MPGIGNNLYPPIVSTAAPAFVRDASCKVYFSLSRYNSETDIKNVQVIVNNLSNNLTALSVEKYPTGVMITDIKINTEITREDKYYVEIFSSDIEGGIFELNSFYKVQIRFTGIGAQEPPKNNKIASWLVDNQGFFSEWSTVCLIRGIEKPLLYIRDFDDVSDKDSDEITLSNDVIDITGYMYYAENNNIEKEYLKSYRIQLYNANDNVLLSDSGEILTNIYNPNEINYTLKYLLQDGISYKVVINYTTNNNYIDNKNYIFSILRGAIDKLDANINVEPDIENGRMKVNISSSNGEIFLGNITIRRSSNETNFMVWEDIKTTAIMEGKPLDYIFYDYTVQSGIFYKYCVQKRTPDGQRGAVVNARYPVMIEMEDIFLNSENVQLKIKYDPTINSFKRNLIESKTDTIGSKYPYITRNANVEYKSFSISGLITSFCDEDKIFFSEDNIYQDNKSLYEEYNQDNNITKYQDYIYESHFREKVMDFLYKNNIKLFRSNTEGNILIKLMDISFTPNKTLGRMLYSFSATAYEIDQCTIDNYEKYNIQLVGEVNSDIKYQYNKIGQLKGIYSNKNIISILKEHYSNMAVDKYLNEIDYLNWLRLEFNSAPYLIRAEDGVIEPLPEGEEINENIVSGYIVYINNNPIIVSNRGYYELKDEDTNIQSLSFPVDTDVTIDYMTKINVVENVIKIARRTQYSIKVGQIWSYFNANESIVRQLYSKYKIDHPKYYQKLVAVDRIIIEVVPHAIAYIKDSFDEGYCRHEIGSTGVLELYDDEAIIEDIYFKGIHLKERDKQSLRDHIDEDTYINTNITVNSKDEINTPIKNGVYFIGGSRMIYYMNNWYAFDENNDVLCPVEGLINYIYELVKGEY